jgi:hypothetical protein
MAVEDDGGGKSSSLIKIPSDTGSARSASAKQIKANRSNALRSTGPRTPAGKAASRVNAVKHGLRSHEVVILNREDAAEFEALFQELCDDWSPQGHTESELVRELAIAEWRLRRARRAEQAEIRAQLDEVSAKDPDEAIRDANALFPSSLPKILKKSVTGIDYLQRAIVNARAELQRDGEVSEETCKELTRLFGDAPGNPAVLLGIWFHSESEDTSPLPDGPKPDKKAAALEELGNCFSDLERLKIKVRRQEKAQREIDMEICGVPSGPVADRTQRYETAIKRELQRTIELLERLQRRRRGEPPGPTVNVNLSRED